MVTRANIVGQDDSQPNSFGWLQLEKKTAIEFQKLTLKSPTAMATLMLMVGRMSRTNALVMSQQAIAEELGVARKSINIAVKLLEDFKFIETTKVGNAMVYSVNSRVAWQGKRGAMYSVLNATIYAVESEQDKKPSDTPLIPVPAPHPQERIVIGNEKIDPPDQGELTLF